MNYSLSLLAYFCILAQVLTLFLGKLEVTNATLFTTVVLGIVAIMCKLGHMMEKKESK